MAGESLNHTPGAATPARGRRCGVHHGIGAWRWLVLLVLLLVHGSALAGNMKSVRVWPTAEFSRVTLEFDAAVRHTAFPLANPNRMVVDLHGVAVEPLQAAIAQRSGDAGAHIVNLRAALNRPGVARLVVELRDAVRAQVFTIAPSGEQGFRLVIDLYPAGGQAPAQSDSALSPGAPPATPRARSESAAPVIPPPSGARAPGRAERAAPASDPAARPAPGGFVRLANVTIDAGHGGVDPGAIGPNGTREKDVTLSVAQRIRALLEREPNIRVHMTREGDYFLPLHERVNRARRAQADLFISIHADAFIKPHARGSSVFALSERGATSAAARWLAKRENDADLVGGVNIDVRDRYLRQTLIDLSQTAQIADSLKFGRAVLDQLGEINQLHKPRVEQAGFAVLKAPDIPSILVEMAFISNPDEERRLNDPAFQDALARAIVDGVKRYFEKYPPVARPAQRS